MSSSRPGPPSARNPTVTHRVKRKPAPQFPYSSRYPAPDPTDPFAPLSVLRDRSHPPRSNTAPLHTLLPIGPSPSAATASSQLPSRSSSAPIDRQSSEKKREHRRSIKDIANYMALARQRSKSPFDSLQDAGAADGAAGPTSWRSSSRTGGYAFQLTKHSSLGPGVYGSGYTTSDSEPSRYHSTHQLPSSTKYEDVSQQEDPTTPRPGVQRHESRRRSQSVFTMRSKAFSLPAKAASPQSLPYPSPAPSPEPQASPAANGPYLVMALNQRRASGLAGSRTSSTSSSSTYFRNSDVRGTGNQNHDADRDSLSAAPPALASHTSHASFLASAVEASASLCFTADASGQPSTSSRHSGTDSQRQSLYILAVDMPPSTPSHDTPVATGLPTPYPPPSKGPAASSPSQPADTIEPKGPHHPTTPPSTRSSTPTSIGLASPALSSASSSWQPSVVSIKRSGHLSLDSAMVKPSLTRHLAKRKSLPLSADSEPEPLLHLTRTDTAVSVVDVPMEPQRLAVASPAVPEKDGVAGTDQSAAASGDYTVHEASSIIAASANASPKNLRSKALPASPSASPPPSEPTTKAREPVPHRARHQTSASRTPSPLHHTGHIRAETPPLSPPNSVPSRAATPPMSSRGHSHSHTHVSSRSAPSGSARPLSPSTTSHTGRENIPLRAQHPQSTQLNVTTPPSRAHLNEAAHMLVVQENGLRVPFGDLWKAQRTVVIFIRHFWCALCQDYLQSIKREVDHAALHRSGIKLIFVGCGSHALLKSYRHIFDMPYQMYTDPTTRLYDLLGMTRTHRAAGHLHADTVSSDEGKYVRHGAVSGLAMVVRNALKVVMPPWEKGGDVTQLGGEFVLGPGLTCVYAHRMRNTRSHAPILDVLAAAGFFPRHKGDHTTGNPRPSASPVDKEEQWMAQRRRSLARLKSRRSKRRAGRARGGSGSEGDDESDYEDEGYYGSEGEDGDVVLIERRVRETPVAQEGREAKVLSVVREDVQGERDYPNPAEWDNGKIKSADAECGCFVGLPEKRHRRSQIEWDSNSSGESGVIVGRRPRAV